MVGHACEYAPPMAMLRDSQSGDPIPLASRVLVGRAPTATLRLDDKRVSGEHATLLWTGSEWTVRDLGSRNGTFVDGQRLEPGEPKLLRQGETLSFGEGLDFLMLEAGPPGPVARELEGQGFVASEGGLLALPDGEHPEIAVFDDGRGSWMLEVAEERRPAQNGDIVTAAGQSWQILLPAQVERTAVVELGPTIDTIDLRFGVSRNEEFVQMSLVYQGRVIELEKREHHYVLLVLARQRRKDHELPAAEQGWLERDRLLRWLKLDPNALNVAIYRARGQLAAMGVDGAAGIVEVRRGQRRLGVEPERLQIGPLV